MDYVVVIPSYRRASLLNEKTLSTLHKHHIPKERIYIFVVEEEFELYTRTLPSYQIVVGSRGLIQQRKFIEDFFPEGQYIVSMDDDIEHIDLSLTPFTSLHQFIHRAFEICLQKSSFIWGARGK